MTDREAVTDGRTRNRARILLHYMRELMSHQLLPFLSAGCVLAGAKGEMISGRVGVRSDGACGLRRTVIGVHTHLAEVMTEARLHQASCRRIASVCVSVLAASR
jgi:hypothetical protein